MLRGDDRYKLAIIKDDLFWRHIAAMSNMNCIQILATLSNSYETIIPLMNRGVAELYGQMLNHQNPEARAEGGLGLSNLAESPVCAPYLCQPQVLYAVQSQLRNTDVFRVRKQVYWFICSLIPNAPDMYPSFVDRGYIGYICDILYLPSENNLKVKALCALRCLLKWNPTTVWNLLEEGRGDEALHNLTTDSDLELQNLALKLVESGD